MLRSFCALLLSISGAFLYLSPNLPSVDSFAASAPDPLRVYSADDKLIAEFGEMRRSPIRFDDIPQAFIHALLAAEDDNFANHYGVDITGLMRAAAIVEKRADSDRWQHHHHAGCKNYFLTSERSFSRKINEILLALQIERELSKTRSSSCTSTRSTSAIAPMESRPPLGSITASPSPS